MTSRQPTSDLRLMTRGAVDESAREYARVKVLEASRSASQPVLDAHAELRQESNPSLERPAIAKATLDVGGRRVRAHVAAESMREAIDLLEASLRQQLRTLAGRERERVHEGKVPVPGEWRHSDLPSDRPVFWPRAVPEREVRRIKSLAPAKLTPEQAALEMTALSYDFFLFHDATSGGDSVLYRAADGRFVLKIQAPGDPGPFAVDSLAPVRMTVEEATALLNGTDDRFVFFSEPPSGRGAVLYRRYDGHYGLLTTHSRP
jgi:ribosome-associated translation inhibitor RaiA